MNTHSKETIAQLVNRIKRDDEKAFQQLFNRYWEPLFVMARAIIDNEAHAKDLVQDVWLDFWERRHKIENNNIEAYLKQATKFRVFKELKKLPLTNAHKEYLLHVHAETETDHQLIFDQTNNIVTNSIQELPDRCREIFILSREENLTNAEIAHQLNISKRTVETHISHALKNLRLRLTSFLFSLLF
ncbi:RNA polymerase sigma-70 factor [Galbibacter pacificus]|uniref:RNA polymerase sigma-70 factor n=1 Tax=Galbibacter pacificus TaxID=2996052 RepID=A0ABT6FR38_9FLAO|nr:RNA polymerase sigma-70 factor [Galbibacter pacificus]MDG3581789.1 RNA polymerase sigma-70 factor [Galbibacter pacificus]MDG3585737.1 RNA polymerase sigma-70 factor [Galbibacter pacificus]